MTSSVYSKGNNHYLNVCQVTGGMVQFYYFGESRPDYNSLLWKAIAGFYKHKK
jgi:hypothetical protein